MANTEIDKGRLKYYNMLNWLSKRKNMLVSMPVTVSFYEILQAVKCKQPYAPLMSEAKFFTTVLNWLSKRIPVIMGESMTCIKECNACPHLQNYVMLSSEKPGKAPNMGRIRQKMLFWEEEL